MNTGIINVCGPIEAVVYRRFVRDHSIAVNGHSARLELLHCGGEGRLVGIKIDAVPLLPPDLFVRLIVGRDAYMEWELPTWFEKQVISWPLPKHGAPPALEFRRTPPFAGELTEDKTTKHQFIVDAAMILKVRP